jgi:hypothetical protein
MELKIKYFYAQIWTAQISMKSLGKFDFWRNGFQASSHHAAVLRPSIRDKNLFRIGDVLSL